MRCGFSHTACGLPGRPLRAKLRLHVGEELPWGENLACGRGKRGSARKVLKAWLNSPPHRATMLRGSFDDAGLGLRRGRFSGHATAVWVLQLGCHGCS